MTGAARVTHREPPTLLYYAFFSNFAKSVLLSLSVLQPRTSLTTRFGLFSMEPQPFWGKDGLEAPVGHKTQLPRVTPFFRALLPQSVLDCSLSSAEVEAGAKKAPVWFLWPSLIPIPT